MALNEDFVLPLNQWYLDHPTRTLKIGNGTDKFSALPNIFPVSKLGLPAEDDNNMYGVRNGEYVRVLTDTEEEADE